MSFRTLGRELSKIFSVDKHLVKSLEEWIGAKTKCTTCRESLMSASGASTNQQSDSLESRVSSDSPPSKADSIAKW